MANVKWQMGNIKYQVSYIKWKMSNGTSLHQTFYILHLTFRRICSAGFVPRETIRLYNMQNQPITKKNKN